MLNKSEILQARSHLEVARRSYKALPYLTLGFLKELILGLELLHNAVKDYVFDVELRVYGKRVLAQYRLDFSLWIYDFPKEEEIIIWCSGTNKTNELTLIFLESYNLGKNMPLILESLLKCCDALISGEAYIEKK